MRTGPTPERPSAASSTGANGRIGDGAEDRGGDGVSRQEERQIARAAGSFSLSSVQTRMAMILCRVNGLENARQFIQMVTGVQAETVGLMAGPSGEEMTS